MTQMNNDPITTNEFINFITRKKEEPGMITCALKGIKIENPTQEDIQCLINEFEILRIFNHPNIIKAFQIFMNDERIGPSILIEHYSITLEQAIKMRILSKVQKVFAIYQIANGMKYIHEHQYIHRNLKQSNIQITNDGTVKICDFYNAQKISDENESEMADDVYSFGTLVYFILSGYEYKISEIVDEFASDAKNLISACWSEDLDERSTFDFICQVLENGNCDLDKLSQLEIQEVSHLINQCKEKNQF